MYRQIYPLNEQVLSSSIDLPRTLDRTQLPDKEKIVLLSKSNSKNNINTRQTAEQIKNQIKTIEGEVRLLRQGMTSKVNLPINKTNVNRVYNDDTKNNNNNKNNNFINHTFMKSGAVKRSGYDDINENGYDDESPLEVNGFSLQPSEQANTHLHNNAEEVNNQYNLADNYLINKKMQGESSSVHPVNKNTYLSSNKNRYSNNTYYGGKPSVSKRSISMPIRPASARSAGSKNSNVHIAFGHRVYPASESDTQGQTHQRYTTSQNNIADLANIHSNYERKSNINNNNRLVKAMHKEKRSTIVRPQPVKSSRATLEVETAVHTPHKRDYHNDLITNNINIDNNNNKSKESELFTQNTYWSSSARALESKNSPFSHFKYNSVYTDNIPYKILMEVDPKEKEQEQEQKQEQEKQHVSPLKRDKKEKELTHANVKESADQTEKTQNDVIIKSLQSQVHQLQEELKERDVLLRNATRALVSVQRDKLAVDNKEYDDNGINKESMTLHNNTAISRNTTAHNKSREHHGELQQLESEQNSKDGKVELLSEETKESTNKLVKCDDYDALSTQMHNVQLNLSHAQNEIHAIHEKCILSQEREAELQMQLMHREQEKERMEIEMKRLLVVIDKMRQEKIEWDKRYVENNKNESIENYSNNNTTPTTSPSLTFLLKELNTLKQQNNNYMKTIEDQKSTIALLSKRLTAWEEWYKNEHAVSSATSTLKNSGYNINPSFLPLSHTHKNNKHMLETQSTLLDKKETPEEHNLPDNEFKEYVHELELSSSESSSSSMESEQDTKAKQEHTSLTAKHVHSSARKLIAKEAALMEMAAAEEAAAKVALEQWMKDQLHNNYREERSES